MDEGLTLEKFGIFDANAKEPEIMTSKSLNTTVNRINVFKSSDSNPLDFIKATQSGFILLALKIKTNSININKRIIYKYPVK